MADLEWDVVDEASLESFPASDPPGWSSHHASAFPLVEETHQRRRGRRRVPVAIALVALGIGAFVGWLRRRTRARAHVA